MLSAVAVILHRVLHLRVFAPALPVSVLGTAVAFYVGFKNNQAYERFWEARTLWGAIVNTSRTFAVAALDHVRSHDAAEAEAVRRDLVMRHLAWVHALRIELRGTKDLERELAPFLAVDELADVVRRPNVAAHVLRNQSRAIEELVERGLVRGIARHYDLRASVRELYTHQGGCERIKNTPLVPHYTAAATLLVWLYIVLVPFSLLDVLEGEIEWMTVPLATFIGWIYDTMDRIGRHTENPFSGQPTDVPVNALARTIERELRSMLGEPSLPPPLEPQEKVLD